MGHPVSEPIDDNIESESMSPQDHNELVYNGQKMKDTNNDNKNNNHLSLSSSSNHTRKDTPTPNDINIKSFGAKKNKKKWYKPGVNVINSVKNQEKNMLLKSR